MRSFLFILCTAVLFNGVAAASGGRGAALREALRGSKVGKTIEGVKHAVAAKASGAKSSAVAVVGALIIGASAICGLQGCETTQRMAPDILQAKPTSLENPFKIGLIYEHEFTRSLWGAQLAVKQANLAGGIDGRQIVLLPKTIYGRDEAFTVRVTKNLINYDDVDAIVGANYSTISEYVDEPAAISGTLMITMGSTSGTITRAGENIFLSAPPNAFQARVAAKYAVEQLDAKTAAIVYWTDDAYSMDLAESYKASLSALGIKVVLVEDYNYDREMKNSAFAVSLNDSGLVDRVLNAQADIVFLPSFEEIGIVAAQLRAAGEDAIFFGADGWGTKTTLEWGGKALDGAYYTDLFHPESSPEFTAAYEAEFGFTPDFLAASGYDATNLAIQAALRASPNTTKEELVAEMNNTSDYFGASEIIRYDIERHPIRAVVLNGIEVVNGVAEAEYIGTFAP